MLGCLPTNGRSTPISSAQAAYPSPPRSAGRFPHFAAPPLPRRNASLVSARIFEMRLRWEFVLLPIKGHNTPILIIIHNRVYALFWDSSRLGERGVWGKGRGDCPLVCLPLTRRVDFAAQKTERTAALAILFSGRKSSIQVPYLSPPCTASRLNHFTASPLPRANASLVCPRSNGGFSKNASDWRHHCSRKVPSASVVFSCDVCSVCSSPH